VDVAHEQAFEAVVPLLGHAQESGPHRGPDVPQRHAACLEVRPNDGQRPVDRSNLANATG
jgi:hypothetical protein